MQPNDYKEVDFETYCKTCQFKNAQEDEDPCYECLKEPVNLHSVKPTKWRKRREEKAW